MLRTLEICGSPKEMGRRHGQVLGEEIRQVRRILLTYLARISLYAGALPLYGLIKLLSRRFWPYVPLRLKEEMGAVAEGAAVGLGTILLINVLDDLANNTPRCSALAADKALTGQDSYLMGRNLDYPLFTDYLLRHQTLFFMEPDHGYPLASLSWPGYVGVCTGINRSGVSLAQLSSVSQERTLKGMPAAMRFRLALEKSDTITSAASHIMSLAGTIGNNLLLCGSREALVVEISPRRHEVRYPQNGLLTVTNHYQGPTMQVVKGRFPKPPPYSVLSSHHFSEAHSLARNHRLRELARGRKLGPEEFRKILADPQIANPGTAVCAIFRPSDRTLWVARGPEPPVNQGPLVQIKVWD